MAWRAGGHHVAVQQPWVWKAGGRVATLSQSSKGPVSSSCSRYSADTVIGSQPRGTATGIGAEGSSQGGWDRS